jgi:hypothetical protein
VKLGAALVGLKGAIWRKALPTSSFGQRLCSFVQTIIRAKCALFWAGVAAKKIAEHYSKFAAGAFCLFDFSGYSKFMIFCRGE